MTSSLSHVFFNLVEKFPKLNVKIVIEYESIKDNLIKCKCLSCNIDYPKKLDEEIRKQFKNTFKFSNNDINKFIL